MKKSAFLIAALAGLCVASAASANGAHVGAFRARPGNQITFAHHHRHHGGVGAYRYGYGARFVGASVYQQPVVSQPIVSQPVVAPCQQPYQAPVVYQQQQQVYQQPQVAQEQVCGCQQAYSYQPEVVPQPCQPAYTYQPQIVQQQVCQQSYSYQCPQADTLPAPLPTTGGCGAYIAPLRSAAFSAGVYGGSYRSAALAVGGGGYGYGVRVGAINAGYVRARPLAFSAGVGYAGYAAGAVVVRGGFRRPVVVTGGAGVVVGRRGLFGRTVIR